MLASSLLAGALLSVGYVASKSTTVHALTDMSVKDTQNPLKINLIATTGNPFYSGSVLVDIQRNSSNDNPSLYYDLVNEDTGAIVASYSFNSFGNQTRSQDHVWLLYAEDEDIILMFIVKVTLGNDILVGQKYLKYQTKNMYP